MAERITMAEGRSPEVSTDIVNRSALEPNVVISPESRARQSILDRLLRRRPQALELVSPGQNGPEDIAAFEARINEQAKIAKEKGLPLPIGGGADLPQIYIADAHGRVTGAVNVRRETQRPARPLGEGAPPPPPEQPPTALTPEEGPPPLDGDSLELEASPERGKEIVEKIIKMEARRAAGDYEKVDWVELDKAYRELRIHIAAKRKMSLRVDISESESDKTEQPKEPKFVSEEALKDTTKTIQEWLKEYRDDPGLVRDSQFIREITAYFAEAKRIGLLDDLDDDLSSIYEKDVVSGIKRKLKLRQIMLGDRRDGIEGVDEKIRLAIEAVKDVYTEKQWEDENIELLNGVWELYAEFARQRFITAINSKNPDGVNSRPYISTTDSEGKAVIHEFNPGNSEVEGGQENFWRTTQSGYYIEIYARTSEEFAIAAESYISMLKSITADPQQTFEQSSQFLLQMNRTGHERGISASLLKELTDQVYARVGSYGADHANELYHGGAYKQYLDFINKDGGGPDRYLELLKLLDGEAAAALFLLDKDPRWEVLFALYGSRGQLAMASEVQKGRGVGLFEQVKEALVEELMGIRIRNKNNVANNLAKFMSDREFASMFDGLYVYDRDQHDRYYFDHHHPKASHYGDANIKVYYEYEGKELKDVPESKRRAFRLGRIQLELHEIEQRLKNGERPIVEEKDGKDTKRVPYDRSRHKPYQLLPREADRKLYKESYDRAEKAFEVAFELYGILGEKSKRGGGVFKVNKTGADREEYQDFVPIHYAEKFVQFVETMTKIRHADLSAKDRTAKVALARKNAIKEFKTKGFQAKPVYEDGTPIKLKRPEKDPEGNVVKDADGNVVVEEVDVDFYTATHHFYSNWTSHTYWSYQEEDRHMLLDPATFITARKIRAGEIDIEDVKDPWALQLLILDPTLKRVRRFTKNFEDRERKLTMAAVEDSYQSHWRITRELHKDFFPSSGTPAEIGIYYGLQDFGGYRKMIENMRAQIAEDPERFARRGRNLLPNLHNPAAALSEIWGQGNQGVLGVMRMFGAPIYRQAGAMALDKFAAQSEIAGKIYDALMGSRDREGNYEEGLLLKPTNNSDKLSALYGKLPEPGKWKDPKEQNAFCYGIIESLGRLKRYEALLTVMETAIRNASGAQWLENVEILTQKGQLLPQIERQFASLPDINQEGLKRSDLERIILRAEELEKAGEGEFNKLFNSGDEQIDGIDVGSISANTGTGRHSAKAFHDVFKEYLLDEGSRGGADLYPDARMFYRYINDKIIIYDPKGNVVNGEGTIWSFVFSKFVPT